MDVRREQLPSYERRLLSLSLCVAGFSPRHLNRCAASLKIKQTFS
jgi:hypothetical protein